ncbi:hypothetical protein [Acetobacter syzygii]|nr:hypothetical protein [Acetobacter syzygii]
MTSPELAPPSSLPVVILLTISLICFLIDWMKSVSAKLDRIITLLQEKRT